MRLVLPILVAALLAFGLGWFAASAFRAQGRGPSERVATVEPSSKSEGTPLADPSMTAAVPSAPERVDAASASSAERRMPSEGLISEALRQYALAEIGAGWNETRKEPIPEALLATGYDEFDHTVRSLPREIGRRLAMRQGQIETIAGDDPFAVIAAIEAGSLGPQIELVDDAKRFEKYFACTPGAVVNGMTLAGETDPGRIESGLVLQFPSGVHDVSLLNFPMKSDVSCVTIAGTGMDQTLLNVRSLRAQSKLDRLELRDLTLRSQCDAIDLHGAGVWRAQRVRFIGFDCGAGGCGVFDVVGGGVLELVSCRIEGGFGRNPGDGCLLDARGGVFLGRFEDCTFDALRMGWGGWGGNSTMVFDRCRMTNLLDYGLPVDREDDGLVLRSTTIELRPQDAGRLEKRDLAELFPAWIQPTPR